MKISMCYIGDVRYNEAVMLKNHLPLVMELQKICEVETLNFTKTSGMRGNNPYDHGEPDIKYRRGEGGAVQLWDFLHAIENSTGDIVIKMRTDIWFEESAINIVVDAVKRMIADEMDVAYLGSDWLNGHHGQQFEVEEMTTATKLTPDFCIIARRDKIRPIQDIKDRIERTPPQKRRSGNKTFCWLVRDKENVVARAKMVFCRLWLIRKSYDDYIPEDWEVVRDYLQSYIVTKEGGIEKKNFRDKDGNKIPNPMQEGINWWRSMLGWAPMDIDPEDVTRWQSE